MDDSQNLHIQAEEEQRGDSLRVNAEESQRLLTNELIKDNCHFSKAE